MFKDEDFPTLERKSDPEKGISSKPFIQSTEILPEGTYKPLSQAEEVLNWQISNSLSQNSLLKVIEKKVDKMTESFQYQLNQMFERIQKSYAKTKQKIETLEDGMQKVTEYNFHENTRKERELQKLRRQVSEIEEYIKKVTKPLPESTYSPFPISPQKLLTQTVVQHPVRPPFLPPVLPEETTFFGRKSKEVILKKSLEKQVTEEKQQEETSSKDEVLVITNDSDSDTSEQIPSEEGDTEEEYADLSKIFMASNGESPEAYTSGLHAPEINTPPQRISGTPLFSLDDIPPKQWRKKLLDFKA